jgi:hypothetical protein
VSSRIRLRDCQRSCLSGFALALLASCTATQSGDTISEAALLRYDSQGYDAAEMMDIPAGHCARHSL